MRARRMHLMTLAVALVAPVPWLAGAPVATAQSSQQAVSLVATPATVTFGRSTVLSGRVTGPKSSGVKVTLQQTPFPYSAFKNVADATSDPNGNFSFAPLLPQLGTRYQAVAKTSPPVTSPAVQVQVRLAVTRRVSRATVSRGQVVRFSGVVKPAHSGKLARIQRRTSSGWRTVSKTLTRDSAAGQSAYSKKVRIRRGGAYRVRVDSGDGDHLAGTSARKRIRVVG